VSGSDFAFKSLLTSLNDPPSYAVRILLCSIVGIADLGPEEKTAWQVQICFGGRVFRIRDWKRSSWSIDGDETTNESMKIAGVLAKKIRSAGRYLDKGLSMALRVHLEQENYYLENSYYKVHSLYEHFKKEVKRVRKRKEHFGQRIHHQKSYAKAKAISSTTQETWRVMSGGLATLLNKSIKLDKDIIHNASAMVVFFFSYTEVLFEVLYVFRDGHPLKFKEFQRLSWKEKFKYVLPVTTDKELAEIYRDLLAIKRTFRDVLVHGFADDTSVLVPFKWAGLIPISYEIRSKSIAASWIAYSDEPVVRALSCFERFERWLLQHELSQYAILYAESGFEIPLEKGRISEIKKRMTSPKDFKEYLMNEAMARDYWSEQY